MHRNVVFHIVTFIVLFLVFRYGNRFRRLFIAYYAINWIFLFAWWGVYAAVNWSKIGLPYLLVYSFTPVLLGLIVRAWIREFANPCIDLDFRSTPVYRSLFWGFMHWD